jgi:Na+-driven multidrug efflux pump
MGIFDATFGWEISKKLKANFGKHKDKSLRLTLDQRLLSTLLFSLFFGFIGYLIARM